MEENESNEITNDDRAYAGGVAVDAYESHKMPYSNEDRETVLGDLLCDLRHFAHANGLDIAKLWDRADMNYQAEIAEAV